MRSWQQIFIMGLTLVSIGCVTSMPPNIIIILSDDLGYGELGCYGQQYIKTPNIDRLAAEGIRFTQHYSGSTVCAPSRCALLTGLHTGHAAIRDNVEMGGWEQNAREGQAPLPAGERTIADLLRARGYHTAVIGKWGLGGPDTEGHPNLHGFDHWFGYLCQRVAHNYYPTHLWRNDEKVVLDGNDWFASHQRLSASPQNSEAYDEYRGVTFAPDLMIAEAEKVISNADGPFFLLYETPVPHVALQVPGDSLDQYHGEFAETPYLGGRGYLPHAEPRAAYAAMISRLDRNIGRLVDLLDRRNLSHNTLIIFTSDNGPTYAGGVDHDFFNSNGPLRGLKGQLYEGGIRVPLIAKWPERVPPGRESSHVCASWDLLPTIEEITRNDQQDLDTLSHTDGISLVPTLTGHGPQQPHDYLYWEYKSGSTQQAIRWGKWKGVLRKPQSGADAKVVELYDLEADLAEVVDLSDEHPLIAHKIVKMMQEAHHRSEQFPLSFEN
ncbi:MAG: arylsulfatase [Planctomycetota bacterium]|jgi:arylsulfatase